MASEDGRIAECANGYRLAESGYACECDNIQSLGEISCVKSCGRHEVEKDKVCVCDSGYDLDAEKMACVASATCARYVIEDEERICVEAGVCSGDLKLAIGSADLCVRDCAKWVQEGDELRCVEDCAHWWDRAEDGLCKEQKWRRTTAIVVPVVMGVLVIIGVVLGVMLGKKVKKG